MEKEHLDDADMTQQPQEETGYTPRPRWQVWAARIGLFLFILVLIFYYLNMFRGGM